MNHINKLASIGSHPLLGEFLGDDKADMPYRMDQVVDLLRAKNGFYAFKSALHVFPIGINEGVMDIDQWNAPGLWRDEYHGAADNLLFFAEDAFGYQFCIGESGIFLFDPEDASIERIADNMEEWALRILEDYNQLAGYPLAHEWQEEHGGLPENHRLMFITPLILGGEVTVENLGVVDSVELMRGRAHIYNQIKDLPDGSVIQLDVME